MKNFFVILIVLLLSYSALAGGYTNYYHVYGYGQSEADAQADMVAKAKDYIAADKDICIKQNGQFTSKEEDYGCDVRASRGYFYCIEGVNIQCTIN
jgi:hypothetical protein